ncbi:DUF444 family protein, partial [Escherichia coli]|uniref:DUF444 family protein n=1 Tax=Escherichia coli TaxID=562 RepID=UPI0020774932
MTWFIDRRLNGKNKSMVNRQRFLRRYKAQIKQSISEAINKRSVTDVDSGESVSIPTEDISEPMFHQGRGGLRHRVHPGNDHFVQNDRIERPQGGGGGSGSGQGQASQDEPECPAVHRQMVNKHGFDRQQLQEILSQAKRLDSVLRLMDNQAPTTSVKPPS